jgi:Ser/Thr protein kinase RdoA (MazF antagonist)
MQQAYEAGSALGAFHRLLANLPVDQLVDTLPGFHITPQYLTQYDKVVAHASPPSSDRQLWQFCHDMIETNRALAGVLVNAQPPLKQRVMHGDPKLNNMLFDQDTGKAVSIVDLDTVKPGLIQFDIADCIRSCCNRSGELPEPGQDVVFDMTACYRILEGYLSQAADMLDHSDVNCLANAIQLLPFELGLRFFTDYLQGNRYFKVASPNDNLYRANTQFMLLNSIQQQHSLLAEVISDLGAKSNP